MSPRSRLICAFAMAVALAAAAAGCASPRDIRREIEPFVLNRDGGQDIYIATEDSSWKLAVITDLATRLGPDYRITVDNLQTLGRISVVDWDVVIVLSAFYAFGLQSDTAAFLKDADPKDRIVLVATSNISNPDDYGVDTVSAASQGNTAESAKTLTPARAPEVVGREVAQLVVAKTR